MSHGISANGLNRFGREAMDRLFDGDRFRCRRILVDLAELKIPFQLLECAVEGMAERVGSRFEGVVVSFREVVHSALDQIGVVALAASFYGCQTLADPDLVLGEVERLVVCGRHWWIADLAAARALRPMLAAHPDFTWDRLVLWSSHDNPWLRRSVAMAVSQTLKNPRCDASAFVSLLESMREDPSQEVRRGVTMALRTLCKNHQDVGLSILRTWAHHADARVATLVRGGMSGLGMRARREVEAVLATR